MKTVLTIVRYLVGLLFIFSGLVKANDPLGLSYKMLEFFEAWNWHFLDHYTLIASIAMNVCEVLAGVAIIIGWRSKWVSWFLLLLILFFSFLTAYVLFSGKIKECGCFGDCIPLSGLHTFLKDILLLLMILFLFFNTRNITSLFSSKLAVLLLLVSLVTTISVQLYALKYLPFVDCLPYKKGNNIIEQMKVPVGAVSDSFAISFKYNKNGKIIAFDKDHFPTDFDSSYEFVDRYQKQIRKGNATPPIIDFSLKTLSGTDTTTAILNQSDKYVLLFAKDFSNVAKWKDQFDLFLKAALRKNIAVYLVTADVETATHLFKQVMILKCDATVIKTAARVNPTYVFMKKASILNKLSYANVSQVFDALAH